MDVVPARSDSREIRRRQRDWARFRGIAVDGNGYIANSADNLFLPLSAAFLEALTTAGGGETKPQRNRPAKLHALHSSAVLAINFFQHWEGRRGLELPQALGIDGTLEFLAIEQQFPTGLKGTHPTLDVVLTLADTRLIAIESKFTEWLTKQRPKLDDFRAKYLTDRVARWSELALPDCQHLAAAIADGSERFHQLDALQLLKHALGLARSAPRPLSLLYLYYDSAGSTPGERHRAEIDRFTARVDSALGFSALSYQALFARLAETPGIDRDYLGYLGGRYALIEAARSQW